MSSRNAPLLHRLVDRSFGLLALAWLAGIAAYGNGLHGAFQFDDFNVIVDNARVHSLAAWWQATMHGGLRPLLNLSYTLCWQVGHGQSLVFHIVNLGIHLIAVACVFELTHRLARPHLASDHAAMAAGWAALLFAVHPALSEGVTYVSGRSSSMMTALYLGALVYYTRHDAPTWRQRVPALTLFLLAVATKETALLFPLALLVWDVARGAHWHEAWRRQWLFWAVSLGICALLLAHPGYRTLLTNVLATRELADNLPSQLHGFAILSSKLVWPAALNIDPDWPTVSSLAQVLAEAALVIGLAILAMACKPKRPWITLGIFWLLAHLLLPNALLPRTDIANERQLYWASWPLFAALAIECRQRLSARLAWPIVVTLALALGVATFERNDVYRSEVALWEDTARHSPNKARVFNNLGFAYQSAGRPEDARKAYAHALELDPDYLKAENNLRELDSSTLREPRTDRALSVVSRT